jgi:hypothetical protein
MKRSKTLLFIIGMLLMTQPGIAEEKWCAPVDIGEHVDLNDIGVEKLSKAQAKEIFQRETIFKQEALQKYEKLRDTWLKNNGPVYLKKFEDDKIFYLDRDNHPLSANVYEFSKAEAKIYIRFIYGHSRWHHYYIVLGNFLVKRDSYIDEVFSLNELEKRYSYSFKGVTHGMSAGEVEALLGGDYYEYAGQSPQYRNIYYEKYNLEIVIQNEQVKYIQKAKPSWMDTEMKFKR